MSTPLQTVYDAYLGGIEEEEWMIEEDMEILARDWRMLLNKAIFRFRFPRIPLTVTAGTTPQEDYFENTLTNDEIQVLGILLEYFWIKRCVRTWRNIKQQYHSKDFEFSSQANHLKQLLEVEKQSKVDIAEALSLYSRSKDGKPFDYRKLAGKNNV